MTFIFSHFFCYLYTLNRNKHLVMLQSAAKSLDYIIDTASGDHPFDPYLSLLKFDGIMVLVGFPSEIKISPFLLNFG